MRKATFLETHLIKIRYPGKYKRNDEGSGFISVDVLLQHEDDEVVLGRHQYLVAGGLQPQEGQGVGRVQVADYRLGLERIMK